jgi:hypothetical protein
MRPPMATETRMRSVLATTALKWCARICHRAGAGDAGAGDPEADDAGVDDAGAGEKMRMAVEYKIMNSAGTRIRSMGEGKRTGMSKMFRPASRVARPDSPGKQ